MTKLLIRPLSAEFTRNTEMFSNMDPYLEFTLGKTVRRTETSKNGGKNPIWRVAVMFDTKEQDKKVNFFAKSEGIMSDSEIGSGVIDIEAFRSNPNNSQKIHYDVQYEGKLVGQIYMEVQYQTPNVQKKDDTTITGSLQAHQQVSPSRKQPPKSPTALAGKQVLSSNNNLVDLGIQKIKTRPSVSRQSASLTENRTQGTTRMSDSLDQLCINQQTVTPPQVSSTHPQNNNPMVPTGVVPTMPPNHCYSGAQVPSGFNYPMPPSGSMMMPSQQPIYGYGQPAYQPRPVVMYQQPPPQVYYVQTQKPSVMNVSPQAFMAAQRNSSGGQIVNAVSANMNLAANNKLNSIMMGFLSGN